MTKTIAPPREEIFANSRNSNNELLRIVCMFFIVFHHFLVHAVFPDTLDSSVPSNNGILLSNITNGFLYIGVNCFILLSGYYGIKLRWKNIIQLFVICASYGLVGYLFHIYQIGASFGRSVLDHTLFIFSHNGNWWYINCYLMLMCISPLLNAGIDKLNKRSFQVVIIGLTICQIYFGYYWQQNKFDSDGYSFMQFIYMYLIGAYLHRHCHPSSKHRWYYIAIYMLFALVWGFASNYAHNHAIDSWWHPFNYNNPVVIIASIAFFLIFQTFSFQSKVVNWLAVGTLAAYLIQENLFLRGDIYGYVHNLCAGSAPLIALCIACGCSILFLLLVIVIDGLRAIITKPIIRYSSGKLDQWCSLP